ncbi:MAG: succinylglutamate desuccinylase/aspartoacylase family protein [Acidobacteriota bacterium]
MTETVLESAPTPTQTDALPPRLIGRVDGRRGGATLICLGGIHGNEPSGVQALERVLGKLAADRTGLDGTLVAFRGNRKAALTRRRFISNDLNRHWHPERVERLLAVDPATLEAEDEELVELDAALRGVIDSAGGPIFAMDLHTTSGEGACFVVLDDSIANRQFALHEPVTVVVGLEEELVGTVTAHLDTLGARVYGFEAGQHDDPASVDRAEAAIWIALESSGVLADKRPEVEASRELLRRQTGDLPHVVEVIHRHPVQPEDRFRMEPGYENFQTIAAGEKLATDRTGEIVSPHDGLILMPLYQQQGEDGFFLVHPVKPLWLLISKWVRRLDAQRLLPWLPGVSRHPEEFDTFVVDQHTARYLARELFHHLGYRRVGPADGRFLTMTRRHPHG